MLAAAILSPAAPALAIEWSCGDNAEIRHGSVILANNVWNKGATVGDEQCIALDGGVRRWKWSWPGGDLMPEAHHPWRAGSTSRELPVRLHDLEALDAEYTAELEGEGVHNLSFQLWLVDRVPPSPEAVRAEVIVWVANRGMRPAGRRLAPLAAGDARFEVYEERGGTSIAGCGASGRSSRWSRARSASPGAWRSALR